MDSDLESDEEKVDKGESDVDYFMDVPSDMSISQHEEGEEGQRSDDGDFSDIKEEEERGSEVCHIHTA